MSSDFKRDDALVGIGQPLIEPAVFLAQCLAFAGLLRKPGFEIDDLRAPGGNIDGDFSLGGFQRAQKVLGCGELLAQRLTFFFREARFLFQLGDFVAQFAVSGARIVEHRLQADLFGFLGFECAQRLADRVNQLADSILDGVELADLGVGVEQEIAQGFVIAAELGAKRGEQFFVEFEWVVVRRRADRRRDVSRFVVKPGLAGEKAPEFAHCVIPLTPIRPAEATPNHLLTDPNGI